MANKSVVAPARGKVKRTKVTPCGTRVRAAKAGETREQQDKWRDKLTQQGIPSIVFASQEVMDSFCANVKAYAKREALRDELERKYRAGELVEKVVQHG